MLIKICIKGGYLCNFLGWVKYQSTLPFVLFGGVLCMYNKILVYNKIHFLYREYLGGRVNLLKTKHTKLSLSLYTWNKTSNRSTIELHL